MAIIKITTKHVNLPWVKYGFAYVYVNEKCY